MTPEFLRSLQAAIMANPDAKALAVTPDDPKQNAFEADKAIAAIMTAAGFGRTSKAVDCSLAKKLLIKRMRWRAIVKAAADDSHPAVESAYAAVALAEDARMTADFRDPAAAVLLGPLVTAGLLAADDVAALQAMSDVQPTITADQVSRALRGPWGDET